MEERLVLLHLLAGSGTDACESGAHIGRIAAGALRCQMFLNPYEAPSNAHKLCCAYDPQRARWPRPKAWLLPLEGSCSEPLPTVWSLSPQWSSGPGGRAAAGSWSSEAVCAAYRPRLTNLPNLRWAFFEFVGIASCAASMSTSGGLGAASPSAPRPHSNQDSGTIPVISSLGISNFPQAASKLSGDIPFREPPPRSIS